VGRPDARRRRAGDREPRRAQRADERLGGRRDPQRKREHGAGDRAEREQLGPATAERGAVAERAGQQRLAAADGGDAGRADQPHAQEARRPRRRRPAARERAHGERERGRVEHEQHAAGRAEPALAGGLEAALRARPAGDGRAREVDADREQRDEQERAQRQRQACHRRPWEQRDLKHASSAAR